MGFLDAINEIIILLISLLGLVGTGVGVFFAVKQKIKRLQEQTDLEIWQLIMEMADVAMTEVEHSTKSGLEKKTAVLNSITAAANAAGIDMSLFAKRLDTYIDQTISFVNNMK